MIIKAGTLEAIQQASLQIDADSIARGYVPDHKAVLAATKLLTADQSEEFIFTAPKEPGVYYYICTYPGHALIMYGALYIGQKWGSIEKDENIPQLARDRVIRLSEAKEAVARPSVKRFFIKGVGPAAIAVALTNEMNYCWDAGNCRLRFAWSGDFLKIRDTSRSNGNRQAGILGKEFWNGAGDELTYSIKVDDPTAKPDFKGYRLKDGQPEFRYTIGGLEVKEFVTSSPKGLINHLNISNAKAPLKVYAKGNISANAGVRKGDYIIVEPKDAETLTLTISAD